MMARFLRPVYFLWTLVPLALYVGAWQIGLPHVIWSYAYTGGDGYAGLSNRRYVTCTYVGFYGTSTRPAEQARCGWVLFVRGEGGQ